MSCNVRALEALVDGELHGWQVGRVRRHVARCANCQQELAELEALNKQLRSATPLPARKPVRRPMGLVRPAFATLALAGTTVLWIATRPLSTPEKPRTAVEQAFRITERPFHDTEEPRRATEEPRRDTEEPRRDTNATIPYKNLVIRHKKRRILHAPVRVAVRPRHILHTKPHKPRVTEPAPEGQVIVVASTRPTPKAVTVVLNDRDDEGGTIHIESTIPAAYMAAMQKESN
jgi:anti-sigma factor RsiW